MPLPPHNPDLPYFVLDGDTRTWTNEHENFTQRVKGLYNLWNAERGDPWDNYNAATQAIQRLLADQERSRVRGLGAGWSFSKVAATNGYLLNTLPLDLLLRIAPGSVTPQYASRADSLFLCQCGLSIAQLNDVLLRHKKSLKTSGASNGQTIVGAMSTGTHGSAISVGSIPDFIRGLHVIVSPTRSVWLERASDPVLTPKIPEFIGAEVLNTGDDLFNSALVCFGSFGFIHSVLIEAEDQFLLETYRRRMPLDDKMREAITTLDFSGLPMPVPGDPVFHFQVVINPHDLADGVYVTSMYKRPYREDYTPPPPLPGGRRIGEDAPAFLSKILDFLPGLIPKVVNKLVQSNYPLYDGLVGTLGDIFSYTDTRGEISSVAMGFPLKDSASVLDKLLELHQKEGPYPGVFALRFVRRSAATLSPTRFDPTTCILEIDGAQSRETELFKKAVWEMLEANGFDFTFHWGKENNLTARRVRKRFTDKAVDLWLSSRRSLLTPAMRKMFSNQFLEDLDLHT